ncbi:MAG: regulatory protein RecX [Phycisphaerales bacterium]|nr:regulatory protein RecX [Phycisphaerales bacterium]
MSSYYRYKRKNTTETIEPLPTDGSVLVTALRPCRDDPARVTLFVDRRRLGRISLETKADHDIEVGTRWDQNLSDLLTNELNQGNAFRAAVRILTKRSKSKFELSRKLKEYGYESDAISWAIDELTRLQVLDDENYARVFVRNQLARKPAGRRLLTGKLRERGIETEIINLVLDEALEDRDSLADARKLAQSAARSISDRHQPEVRVRRITGRLARRGFDYDTIRTAIDELDL